MNSASYYGPGRSSPSERGAPGFSLDLSICLFPAPLRAERTYTAYSDRRLHPADEIELQLHRAAEDKRSVSQAYVRLVYS